LTFTSPARYNREVKIESEFRFMSNATEVAPIPAPDALLDALAHAGYSNTRSRRAVLMAICEAGGQASGAELLALGRAHHPPLGLVTVYRTLDLLLSLGLVRKLHLAEGCHTYALSLAGGQNETRGNEPHSHGHHIICQRCNRAVEFNGCDLNAVIVTVEAQTGFRVEEHWLEMFGVCPVCRERETAHEGPEESAEQRRIR
jgi:Fur family transcriptional regulator, ferric uptake regulator